MNRVIKYFISVLFILSFPTVVLGNIVGEDFTVSYLYEPHEKDALRKTFYGFWFNKYGGGSINFYRENLTGNMSLGDVAARWIESNNISDISKREAVEGFYVCYWQGDNYWPQVTVFFDRDGMIFRVEWMNMDVDYEYNGVKIINLINLLEIKAIDE